MLGKPKSFKITLLPVLHIPRATPQVLESSASSRLYRLYLLQRVGMEPETDPLKKEKIKEAEGCFLEIVLQNRVCSAHPEVNSSSGETSDRKCTLPSSCHP